MNEDQPTIRSMEVRTVVAPLERPIRTAVGTIESSPLVLIDIDTEEGISGHAYVFAYTPLALAPIKAFLSNIEPLLQGQTITPRDRANDFASKFRLLGRQGIVGMALAGVDMALWDVLSRNAGQPLASVLGGGVASLRAYDSYGAVDPLSDRRILERSLERGFEAIKIKLGQGDLDHDVATVAGVRDIIGNNVELMVDYNQSLTVSEACRRIERLEAYDLCWIEEPVIAEDFEGHATVRAGSLVPIQTGENWWFVEDMAKAVNAEACDYAMLDLMKIGGVSGWISAMGLAAANAIPVSSHLFIEASAHVLAVTPTRHWLEHLDVAGSVLREPVVVENGRIAPRGPGLGIEWDEQAVDRYLN